MKHVSDEFLTDVLALVNILLQTGGCSYRLAQDGVPNGCEKVRAVQPSDFLPIANTQFSFLISSRVEPTLEAHQPCLFFQISKRLSPKNRNRNSMVSESIVFCKNACLLQTWFLDTRSDSGAKNFVWVVILDLLEAFNLVK